MLTNWNMYHTEKSHKVNTRRSYSDRLKALNLPMLKYRHHGEMIELVKIIKAIYNQTCVPYFDFIEISEDTIRTKDYRFKLLQNYCH